MSAPLPVDVRHLADRRTLVQHSSVPVHVAGTHLRHVAESSTAVQLAGVGLPAQRTHLHHVPSSSTTSVDVVADAYNGSSSGSSTCGGAYGIDDTGSLCVSLPPAPTRRVREFIPESKKDDEYWMKRQKNNEAAKRSREKRRANDAVMMRRIHELATENKRLKLELDILRRQLGLIPTTTESRVPSAATPITLDGAAAEDQLMSRQRQEGPSSMATCYDTVPRSIVTTSSYHSYDAVVSSHPVQGEQKQQPAEKTHLHHRYLAYHSTPPSTTEWPTSCSVSATFSTLSSDARTPASLVSCRGSTSGNSLPSIGNLCNSAPQPDNVSGGVRSYRFMADDERGAGCRAPPMSHTLVDSSPIMIFSDVSSSDDDSVDDSFYGQRVDTLTLKPVERVSESAMMESPLNLSTPSRHQSPRSTYCADMSGVVRRSSVDLAQVTTPWSQMNAESKSSSDTAGAKRQGEHVLITRRDSSFSEPQLSRNGTPESSRSTSLSSVASVVWQADIAPPQQTVDDLPLQVRAADQLPGRCGLPLKVRRKLGSSSTDRVIIENATRPAFECTGSVTLVGSRLWSDDQGSASSRRVSGGTLSSVSPEWFQSTVPVTERVTMSDFNVLHTRHGRSK